MNNEVNLTGNNITANQITLTGSIEAQVVVAEVKWGHIKGTLTDQTDLKTALNDKASAESLSSEATRAQTAEQNLNTAINTEKTRAEIKENALETSLTQEATTRSTADTTLTNALNSEIDRATNKENSLETAIETEKTRAENAENSLFTSKQDVISDLETIRSGASSGATAVQDNSYVHTDNNYTSNEKEKLSGIESGANKYVLPSDVVHDSYYTHTDNNYTTTEKSKLESLHNYDDTALSGRVTTIEGKIPSQATSTNQLADKEFVNSSISTETANFKGTFDTLAELQAVENPTNNDYGFVKVVDSTTQLVKQYDRYKYVASTSTWTFEYTLNNSSFTADQWSAINSGATTEKINSIENKVDKETGKGLFSGNYNDLTDKPTIPTVPTNVSAFTNDAGYLTEHQDISGKVDKVDGMGLSHNDFTDTDKNDISELKSDIDNKVDKEDGKGLFSGNYNDLTNKPTIPTVDVTKSYVDTELAKKQDKLTAGEGIKIENNVISYSNDMIYGVSRQLTSSSSAWSRTDASIGKVANATKDGALVQNDFDVIYPWSDIKSCNMNADGSISAWYGDVNFKFDGTNGDVMTYVPPFYYRRWQDGTNEHIQVSKFSFDGALLSEGFYIGRYNTDNDYKSRSNKLARVNTNIATFRTNSRAKGSKWQQLDWHYFLLEILYLVEYADYNSQTKLGRGYVDCGVNWSSPGDTITEVVADNQFVCSSTRYKVGQYITIGTSYCGMQISDGVKITAKSGSTYTIENSYSLSVGNNINSSRVMNGQCDGLGMRSGCYRTDGVGSVIYRGIENIFGNIYQFVDGINIQNYVAYINYNPSTYESNVYTGDYAQVGYTNASGSNTYAKKVGYDSNHPMVALCTETGGSESTYLCDYYYQNSGNRIALVGGPFYDGGTDGLFLCSLSRDSWLSNWYSGGRLLRTI